ncbi:MAG: hypothetical protein KBH07_12355 [Flavobacteriales bacterium]|nr:hypothetical protein [Flavobacteriales bacterium]
MSAKKKAAATVPDLPRVDPTKMRINRITMIHGKLEATEAYLNKPEPPAQVKVDFGHRSGIGWKAERTWHRLYVELAALDDKGSPLGLTASYVFEFHFTIQGLGDFAKKLDDGALAIHPVMANTLMGIMFSTVRGMVLERTKGTYFDGVVLPVIAPGDLSKSWREGE